MAWPGSWNVVRISQTEMEARQISQAEAAWGVVVQKWVLSCEPCISLTEQVCLAPRKFHVLSAFACLQLWSWYPHCQWGSDEYMNIYHLFGPSIPSYLWSHIYFTYFILSKMSHKLLASVLSFTYFPYEH